MEKYYIPTADEFHIGFDFEYKPRLQQGIMSYVNNKFEYAPRWELATFGQKIDIKDYMLWITTLNGAPRNIEDVESYLESNAIRVKLLDRDDIASLGFEHLGSGWFKKGDCRVRKWVKQEVDIYLWVTDEHQDEGDIVFRGNIRNKSELKRILEQLAIDND